MVRLALLDHISSPSALLFPISKAVSMLHRFSSSRMQDDLDPDQDILIMIIIIT